MALWPFSLIKNIARRAATLGDGLTHPFEALAANFKSPEALSKTYGGANTGFSPDFQKYIDSNGGSEAYIKAHKNGTWKGVPFMPNSNLAIQDNRPAYKRVFDSLAAKN